MRGSTVWTGGEKLSDLTGPPVASPGIPSEFVRHPGRRKLLFYSNERLEPDARGRGEPASRAPAMPRSFVSSGTEANENAMRLARRATGRTDVVSFHGGFHGRTADAISAAGLEKYRELGRPNVPGHRLAPFGNLEALESVLDDGVAAVILEPIQSLAGDHGLRVLLSGGAHTLRPAGASSSTTRSRRLWPHRNFLLCRSPGVGPTPDAGQRDRERIPRGRS